MNKKILIVAAHPDDEVLGCFATVAKLINSGCEAYSLILSGGKTSRGETTSDELHVLKREMVKANHLIGVKKVFCADFPDNSFDSVPILRIVKEIEKIKDLIKPDIIFTRHIGDLNIDHQITHKAVLTATRPMQDESVKVIYSMEIPSSTEWNAFTRETSFIPNVFFNVSDTIDKKVEAMGLYHSELREYPHPRSLRFIKESAQINGARVGIEYSENFMLVRSVVNE